MTSLISNIALDFVRSRATELMDYECKIERVQLPSFDESTGKATSGGRITVYTGPCRIWEVSGGGPIMIGEDDIVMQNTQLSIPWNVTPVPKRDDEVEITSSHSDTEVVGKRFVIDSAAKAGELRATRRFSVRGYEKG